MSSENNGSTNTFQTNIKQHDQGNLTDYALFLGGLNVTRDSLIQYDPLRTGYGRLFMIRQPIFVMNGLGADKMKKFKHILEYGNYGVQGNGDIQLDANQLAGGYANRSVEIPSVATDNASDLTVQVYEFSGSPVREVIQYWITGISDLQSGYSTYHRDNNHNKDLKPSLANETAEFIYVATDQTGMNIEYACLWANAWPTQIKLQHFDFNSGDHQLGTYDIQFNAVRYMSPQINQLANQLIKKYNVLMDSLNFNSGYNIDDQQADNGLFYEPNTGKLHAKSSGNKYNFVVGRDSKNNGIVLNNPPTAANSYQTESDLMEANTIRSNE
jgi:hypothetical protein